MIDKNPEINNKNHILISFLKHTINTAKATTKNTNLLKENANLQGKINNLLNENSGLKTALTRFKSENEAFRVEIDRLKSELSTISHQSSSQQQQNPSSTKFNLEQW